MAYILRGIQEAFRLIFAPDAELYNVLFLSLRVSGSATLIAIVLFAPLGILLGLSDFRGKGLFSRLLYTCMSTPSVVVGLMLALIFTRNGPFGFLDLMYTPKIMIIAQTVLIAPLILGLTYNLANTTGRAVANLATVLGASGLDKILFVMKESVADIIVIGITAFSRAISEVGAVMVVGGNIKGQTRVLTTSISMLNSMGEYDRAIAMGICLLIISFIITAVTYKSKD